MWPLLLAGAGLGVAKNIEAQSQADAERKRQAAIARYSPWTGMNPNFGAIKEPSLLGNIATGAATGAMANKMFLQGGDSLAPSANEFSATNGDKFMMPNQMMDKNKFMTTYQMMNNPIPQPGQVNANPWQFQNFQPKFNR